MDDTYARRKIFAGALNKSLGIIVSESASDIGTVLTHGLRPIADAVDMDQIVVYRLLSVGRGRRFGQVYRWADEDGGTTTIIEELRELPDHPAVAKWIDICEDGRCVNIHISVSSDAEAAFLTRFGVKSLLLSPILKKGELWGAVAFQDHTRERYFDDLCVEFLCSSAHICANAFIIDETAKALKRSNELADTINKMSEIFLTQSGKTFEEMMNEGGELLAAMAELDRFSLFRNTVEDGALYMTQIYRWEKTSGGTTEANKNFVHVAYSQVAPEWERIFIEGKSINGPVSIMPEREAALSRSLGTLSAFIAPIHINGAPWGFVLFEDQKKERFFDDDLAETMQSAAFLFANAVMRAELEVKLASEIDFTQKIVDTSPVGLNIWDDNFNLINCNEVVQNMFGKPKQYIINNFFEFSPEYQSDGVKSGVKAEELLSQVRNNMTVVSEWMHCSAAGEPIPCEITLTRAQYNNKSVTLVYLYDLRNLKKMEKMALGAEQTQTMIDAVPLCCSLIDKDLNVLTCNKTAVEFFNLSGKEDIQRLFVDLIPEYQPDGSNSKKTAAEAIKKAYDDGYLFVANWTHRSLDGELFPCEVTLVRVEYGGGHVIAAYTRDMRTVKETEAKLREADERTQLMLEQAPFIALLWDDNFHLLDCNLEAVNVFGLSSKEEVKDKFFELLPEYQPSGMTSQELLLKAQSLIFKEKTDFAQIELTMKHSLTGEAIPFDITLVRIKYKDEYAVLTYGLDLRERNAAIAKMMEKTSTLTAFFDSTPDMMFCKDINLHYTECNKAMEDFFHIRNSDIIGITEAEALNIPQEVAAQLIVMDKKVIDEKQVLITEELAKSYDGRMVSFEMIRAPLIREGEVIGLAGILRDITQRKEMARLAKRQAEAEAASRAKSSFLANMSHEMRTPMNAIIGMTSIGKNSSDIERKDYALDKIEDAAVHLLSVINDVLDISKIEANKLELSPVEFNFERMLQKIVNIINFRMDEKHQMFNVNVDRNIPRFVIGDDHRLSQVILNLLSNAVKFSPEQERVGLDVALSGEKDGICELRITVSDNGIGITSEQQAKLFNAFEQADSGITREFGGTGLGLSISKHIVELMNGKIWVESNYGKGSKFIFTVKVKRGEKNITSMLAAGVKWENLRILVVDDESAVCAYFNELFSQLGINCSTAADGLKACNTIEETGSYDIYFVDLRMPGMDGLELTRKIKEHDRERPSVVVMISSADWGLIKEIAVNAGVSKYLLKPLFSSAIIDCVNECLGLDVDGSVKEKVETFGRFADKKLLVVEDVEINREIIRSLLEDTGIIIDCAENGQEAVDMIAAAPDKYDAILMDVQMPKMNGLEATRRIRALTARRLEYLPIIAMTAHVFKSDIEDCLEAGMDDHLGKPLDFDEVLKKLHKYLYAPKSEMDQR
jgi:PAS domain S-box-containing protein